MPKYIYTVITTTLLSWLGFFYYINSRPPETNRIIFIALVIFFFAISQSISLFTYFTQGKSIREKEHIDDRQLFRDMLRTSFVLGAIICIILALRAFR